MLKETGFQTFLIILLHWSYKLEPRSVSHMPHAHSIREQYPIYSYFIISAPPENKGLIYALLNLFLLLFGIKYKNSRNMRESPILRREKEK
jgi:hypothetical protein